MKQWVVGLTALGLLCATGGVAALGKEQAKVSPLSPRKVKAEDEDKDKKDKDKDKDKKGAEEGPKPKVEKGDEKAGPSSGLPSSPCWPSYPCPGPNYCAVTRTVCEYVPVKVVRECEETIYECVKRPGEHCEKYCEWVKKVVPQKRLVCKTVYVKCKEKVWCYEYVCKIVERDYCVYEPKYSKVKQKYWECVPVHRKETRYYFECIPVDRKETRYYDVCVPYTRQETRKACYTVWDTVPVTKCVPVASPAPVYPAAPVAHDAPVAPVAPEPCAGPGAGGPITTYGHAAAAPCPTPCPPLHCYTTWESVPRKVEYTYCVNVTDYKKVRYPYEVCIREYKHVKKPYDVVICEYKNVEKECEVTICEYVKKIVRKKEECRGWEWVCKEVDVVKCEHKWVEEPYDCVYYECVWKERKVPCEIIEYKPVVRKVKKEFCEWKWVSRVVCEWVPCPTQPCFPIHPVHPHHPHQPHHPISNATQPASNGPAYPAAAHGALCY